MTWTRLDDRWTERADLADLDHGTRWHYLSMIVFCSRTGRLDGRLRLADARRCSDVDDPDQAHSDLIAAGLIVQESSGFLLREIDEHVPPPSVRQESERAALRMRRSRAHRRGDHHLCLPKHCPDATVTRDVTRNTGYGYGYGNRTGLDQEQAELAHAHETGDGNDDDQFVKASSAG